MENPRRNRRPPPQVPIAEAHSKDLGFTKIITANHADYLRPGSLIAASKKKIMGKEGILGRWPGSVNFTKFVFRSCN